MSIKVMNWVWDNSKRNASELLLLLAIADHAHDDGGGAYPSVDSLAKKIRLKPRNTQYLLRKLEASGEIKIGDQDGPRGANIYTVIMQGCNTLQGATVIAGGGCNETPVRGATTIAPEPSLTVIQSSKRGRAAPVWEYPSELNTPEFRKAWEDRCECIRGKATRPALVKHLERCVLMGHGRALAAVRNSMTYQGLFEPGRTAGSTTSTPALHVQASSFGMGIKLGAIVVEEED